MNNDSNTNIGQLMQQYYNPNYNPHYVPKSQMSSYDQNTSGDEYSPIYGQNNNRGFSLGAGMFSRPPAPAEEQFVPNIGYDAVPSVEGLAPNVVDLPGAEQAYNADWMNQPDVQTNGSLENLFSQFSQSQGNGNNGNNGMGGK